MQEVKSREWRVRQWLDSEMKRRGEGRKDGDEDKPLRH
jgi:hypothetical protein